ncbi:MAG: glutamate synthase central domain-containing protein, partial [Spirochaetales bacterium]|nr:glutamate synthase central domain-containing protein [Spirochaetales bacterium]
MLKKRGLYDPAQEHDACGVGFVARIDGRKTHQIVEEGVEILCNLEHRGAVGGDQKTGDGAGMLVQLPHKFFSKVLPFDLPEEGSYGGAMIFLPVHPKKQAQAIAMTEEILKKEGATLLGWRDVPITPECLGELARQVLPCIRQFFITIDGLSGFELERKLYIVKKSLENEAIAKGYELDEYYISSFSAHTMVYKGMFVAPQFTVFYPDLTDETFESALALVHQRYSTNTFPSWPLAQPFRYIAHNGEINTMRRNVNNMEAREASLASDAFGSDIDKIAPVVLPNGSDSAAFDNVYELLIQGGRSMEHSMMMMIPEAFGSKYHISEDKRSFYEYHAAVMEPWDGPAAVAFTDGFNIGATLDRNGLRPGRYTVTRSGKVVMASETGVIEIDPEDVLEKGRLAPGKMFVVDTINHRVIKDNEIKSMISRSKPYRRWLNEQKIELKGLLGAPRAVKHDKETLAERWKSFGYTYEDIRNIITPMALNGQEPLGSMGNDSPLPVLSEKPVLLYDYFRQLFAQVTNPPIDPYRENLVMSLMSFVGREQNLLEETPEHCHQLKLAHPVLTNDDMTHLRTADIEDFNTSTVSILFKVEKKENILEAALDRICADVEKSIDEGSSLVILSDRGVDKTHAAVPALLAVSAVHHYLVRQGKRHMAGLLLESGEVREVQHFAALIGYGCSGINPYLVFESLADLKERGYLPEDMTISQGIEHYITSVKKGLLKVMSKMGVSTIRSYRGSQIFEAVGLDEKMVDKYFTGTSSRVGGIDLDVIEQDVIT